jgi:hypothetical protein
MAASTKRRRMPRRWGRSTRRRLRLQELSGRCAHAQPSRTTTSGRVHLLVPCQPTAEQQALDPLRRTAHGLHAALRLVTQADGHAPGPPHAFAGAGDDELADMPARDRNCGQCNRAARRRLDVLWTCTTPEVMCAWSASAADSASPRRGGAPQFQPTRTRGGVHAVRESVRTCVATCVVARALRPAEPASRRPGWGGSARC